MLFWGMLGIGAGVGAAVGSIIGGKKGARMGALAGAAGSALSASALAGDTPLADGKSFFVLATSAALGCGLMAGFFFGFSVVVMKSLAQQPQAAGMATMQTINIVVFNPWFGTAFVGTAAACVLVILVSLLHWRDPGAFYALVGSALYLIGTLLVTTVLNVPKNDVLAAMAPTAPDAPDLWSRYLASWTAWNHVRAAAAFAAAASLTVALY